jgi:hypothetical protein
MPEFELPKDREILLAGHVFQSYPNSLKAYGIDADKIYALVYIYLLEKKGIRDLPEWKDLSEASREYIDKLIINGLHNHPPENFNLHLGGTLKKLHLDVILRQEIYDLFEKNYQLMPKRNEMESKIEKLIKAVEEKVNLTNNQNA